MTVHAIISIRPKHVANILTRTKTVEVRSRKVLLPIGSFLWIYSTLPVGEICAAVRVNAMYRVAPARAWKKFERAIGLSKTEFRSYVNGSSAVSLIALGDITILDRPLSLHLIRRSHKGFQPPQFLKSVRETEGIYKLLSKAAPRLFKGEKHDSRRGNKRI